MASGRSATHSEIKTCRSVELKVEGAGSKIFPSGFLGVIVSGTIPFLMP